MKAGANDFFLKGGMTRFPSAVEREMREAKHRRQQRAAELSLQTRTRQQAAVAELGWAILGQPHWGAPGVAPNVVQLFEFGFIVLGLFGSLLVSYTVAATEEVVHPTRVFIPWALVSLLVAGSAVKHTESR